MTRPMPRRARALAFAFVAGALSAAATPAAESDAAPQGLWLEVEHADGWEKAQGAAPRKDARFADGAALQWTVEPKDDPIKRVGENGFVVTWIFDAPPAVQGPRDLWMRLGFEWVRAPLQWRLDDGPWNDYTPDQPTTDLVELAMWNEIAWGLLGRVELAPGKHTLALRLLPRLQTDPKTKKETAGRFLFLGDALWFGPADGPAPSGPHRPGTRPATDRDRDAARHTFAPPSHTPSAPGAPLDIPLDGDWEIARWDEWKAVPENERLEPVRVLPDSPDALVWRAVRVPGEYAKEHQDLGLAHRVLYRTRLALPADAAGRSLQLHVRNFSMILSLFVNGHYAGGTRNALTEWSCDATPFLQPGKTNEIVFVLKDKYYAFAPANPHDPLGARRTFNMPTRAVRERNRGLAERYDMPVAAEHRAGLLESVTARLGGAAYAADVFVRPLVAQGRLAVDTEVFNPGGEPVNATVTHRVRPWSKEAKADAPAVLTLPARTVRLPARETVRVDVDAAFADATVWWPDAPFLYTVETRVDVPGAPADLRTTRFGYREWGWQGDQFTLNGRPWQLWADTRPSQPTPQNIERFRQSGQNVVRLWSNQNRRAYLDAMDEIGMPVRASGILDGQHADYAGGLRERARDEHGVPLKNAEGKEYLVPRQNLFKYWREQVLAQVKAERNHPSVMVWSLENEIVYINSWNLGQWREVEPAIRDVAAAVEALDPTRPTMVDGGRALMDGSMPVNGAHYDDLAGAHRRDIPDAFYSTDVWYTPQGRKHGQWDMIRGKPVFHGECFFANGWKPEEFALLGGDAPFLGMGHTRAARGLYAKMLSEGWRWAGVAAWHMWQGDADPVYWTSWQPVAALCREWDRTFAVGRPLARTLKLFNQTSSERPLTVRWALHAPEVEPAFDPAAQRAFTLPIGGSETFVIDVPGIPDAAPDGGRARRVFTVRVERDGREVFREDKTYTFIRPDDAPRPAFRDGETLHVWDTHGAVQKRLRARNVPFRAVQRLADVPPGARLIVGADTVPAPGQPEGASSSAWLRFLMDGGRALVLDQAHPLRHQALPADVEPTTYTGRIAFIENADHPAFAGLADDDFFCRQGDHVVYRHAYRKGAGARSLAQCDETLAYSAALEVPVGDGVLFLVQFAVGDKMDAGDPVMTRLFDNLAAHLAAFEPVRKTVRAALPDGPDAQALARTGAAVEKAASAAGAVRADGIAVARATPDALARLADDPAVRRELENGGWLVLTGLEPAGLDAFNRLVGVPNRLRAPGMERVQFPLRRDPLTAGLSLRELARDTGKKVFPWMALMEPVADPYPFVVDATDDLAPFARGDFGRNAVNGFTSEDSWKWIWYIEYPRRAWTFEFDRPETFESLTLTPNRHYHRLRGLDIHFDDQPEPVHAELLDEPGEQTIPLLGRTARKLTFRVTSLYPMEPLDESKPYGIDHMSLRVRRDGDPARARVRPLDNLGGLVRYDLGRGGIVLANLPFKDRDAHPANRDKKDAVLKTLLANLGAAFAGRADLARADRMAYTSLPLPQEKLNLHLAADRHPGWFKGAVPFTALPGGEQTLADVRFVLADFRTSPAAGAAGIRGTGATVREQAVTGLPVGRRADALFFLHTFHPSEQLLTFRPRGDRKVPPPLFLYRVHYADGKHVDVPVHWREDIGDASMEHPTSYKNAALAWVGDPPAGQKRHPVAYAMRWTNPRPDEPITTVDLRPAPNNASPFGAPALLAITAAQSEK